MLVSLLTRTRNFNIPKMFVVRSNDRTKELFVKAEKFSIKYGTEAVGYCVKEVILKVTVMRLGLVMTLDYQGIVVIK